MSKYEVFSDSQWRDSVSGVYFDIFGNVHRLNRIGSFGNDTSLDLFLQAMLCALFGCLSALLFWYIAVYRQRILKD